MINAQTCACWPNNQGSGTQSRYPSRYQIEARKTALLMFWPSSQRPDGMASIRLTAAAMELSKPICKARCSQAYGIDAQKIDR